MIYTPRAWATASLIGAVLWLFFSLAPTPITTVIGLPFLLFAVAAGGWSWRNGKRASDSSAVRRAAWGLGLSCAGCLWQGIAFAIFGTVSFALLAELIRFVQQSTPMP